VLLDSNIIIYAAQPDHAGLRAFVAAHAPAVSAISVVEVLFRARQEAATSSTNEAN
jgi:predicted nucleic acid-binding protein